MKTEQQYIEFPGRILIVGFGSIGRGILPLILRHIGTDANRITVLAADDDGRDVADHYGVRFVETKLTPENHRSVLEQYVGAGDFLLNVSVDVESLDLIRVTQATQALYLDTSIEPWPGGHTDAKLPMARRTNYSSRESALALRREHHGTATAVVNHGANPGLVSHFVKQAMLNIANDTGLDVARPKNREEWASLSAQLGVRLIQVAERDTQAANVPKGVGEFVNTWSIEGFIGEGVQPSELGWGTHERNRPADAHRHESGCGAAIYLQQAGMDTRVRSWTPNEGPFHGLLISHEESISIADYLTLRDADVVRYRPTVHFAYHPCDDALLSAHEFTGKNFQLQNRNRLMMDEIVTGMDELGVLLAGHDRNAYWYGSQLTIEEARTLAPHNNATSLQVTASALSGMIWAMENPKRGLVEPDQIDFERPFEIARPYLGPVIGKYTDWTPIDARSPLFPLDLDKEDPWQFKNIRVS